MPENLFLKQLTIRNYKSFFTLECNNFSQINLITGKNNAGKTTLLESIYMNLGPANPSLLLNILGRHAARNISPKTSNVEYLFYKYQIEEPINFSADFVHYGRCDLKIIFRDAKPEEVRLGMQLSIPAPTTDTLGIDPPRVIEVNAKPVGGKTIQGKMLITNVGQFHITEPVSLYPESVYLSSQLFPSMDGEVERYDQLNRANQIDTFNETLRLIEPNLKRTAIGIHNSIPTILADVGYGLVPLNLLGTGTNKLAKLFLGLAYAANGVFIIDEIEGSFHYSALKSIWSAILKFSKANGTQIFATTHSGECLRAAVEIAKENDVDNLRLHRLDISKGYPELNTIDNETLEVMIANDWELR